MPDSNLFRHARREAVVVLLVWAAALLWTVGYCYLRGYSSYPPESWAAQQRLATPRTAEDFRQIAGLPDWVFVGVLLPWGACTLATVVFALFYMRDDDLGQEGGHGH